MDGLSDDAIHAIGEAGASRTSPLSAVILEYYGGAAGRVPADATAFPHRSPQFDLIIAAEWSDAAEDAVHEGWVRSAWASLQPFSSGRVYSNLIGADEERTGEAYGDNLPRLQQIKRTYDPDNVFRFNVNAATPSTA